MHSLLLFLLPLFILFLLPLPPFLLSLPMESCLILPPLDATLLEFSIPLDTSHETLAPDALILPSICEALVIELHALLAFYVALVQSSPAQSRSVVEMD